MRKFYDGLMLRKILLNRFDTFNMIEGLWVVAERLYQDEVRTQNIKKNEKMRLYVNENRHPPFLLRALTLGEFINNHFHEILDDTDGFSELRRSIIEEERDEPSFESSCSLNSPSLHLPVKTSVNTELLYLDTLLSRGYGALAVAYYQSNFKYLPSTSVSDRIKLKLRFAEGLNLTGNVDEAKEILVKEVEPYIFSALVPPSVGFDYLYASSRVGHPSRLEHGEVLQYSGDESPTASLLSNWKMLMETWGASERPTDIARASLEKIGLRAAEIMLIGNLWTRYIEGPKLSAQPCEQGKQLFQLASFQAQSEQYHSMRASSLAGVSALKVCKDFTLDMAELVNEAVSNLIEHLADLAEEDESVKALSELADIQLQILNTVDATDALNIPAENTKVASLIINTSVFLIKVGGYQKAEKLLRTCLAKCVDKINSPTNYYNTLSLLSLAITAQKGSLEAVSLAEEAIQRWVDYQGAGKDKDYKDLLVRYSAALYGAGKKDDAKHIMNSWVKSLKNLQQPVDICSWNIPINSQIYTPCDLLQDVSNLPEDLRYKARPEQFMMEKSLGMRNSE
ncbi:hypothetical protein [Candidatus Methylobacter oryzae]|uniref:Tetratricopeptide repeat protein n=1 Tax=Candidatus Methylobacter oryzae TaxID=2497749 RepID=A0ABY3CAZ5_9GAMM|nr:hypothetical protein [Candidatus Methylobacter oryzae]TRW95617.1 hypothetical protein EKO24_009815 [Candidatus Methylobacter oryzae]